ncbi:MCE family protein [Nonomuraea endophytica]|uniref:Phospholipid/cholesterol/gamma-HCH transport system substrate-binding protein n=1 Tax=Nonomuraea endophytica TaxID=714136 RepID=A0A7W7ZWL3_9ACTN|nr:MlaD family protein [Nonomuraea endophytica]MBB5075135.1 phospholipid/cholesterol/gamma-HCH transport system substrate-binding protein [Nonomuraea endophytica]
MTTLKAAIKLGLFGLATTLCVAMLAITISGTQFAAASVYRAVFTDATGLRPGDDVRAAGVRVGRVEEVSLAGTRAEVSFTVLERTRLPRGVIAAIRWRNLVGDRYLALSTGRGGPGALRPGELITDTRPALDVTALFNGFRPLLKAIRPEDVNKLSWQIVQVLQGEGGTVDSLLGHVASLTGTLADRDAVIGRVIDNLTAVLAEIAGREDDYSELIADLRSLVSGLAGDRKAIGDSLAALDRLAGVTAGFTERARPDIKAGIRHADSFLAALNEERALIDKTIKDVPIRLNQLTRAVSYGSWFNFYLCSLDVRAGVTTTPKIVNESRRCR